MLDFLEPLANLISEIITKMGYPGIVFVMALENVFPPIPSEAVMPFAGFLASQGKFNLLMVVLAGTLGSIIGAYILYGVGYYGNETIFRGFIRRFGKYFMTSEEDLNKAEEYFKRYQEKAVFVARIIPIVRSIISIPAGFAKMPFIRFSFYTLLGTFLWSFFLGLAGYLLGENWEIIKGFLKSFEYLVLGVCVLAVGIFFYFKLKNKRRHSEFISES